jgi:hypothetical protein
MFSKQDIAGNQGLKATYPGRSPRADKGAGGVYTGAPLALTLLAGGNSMAIGWLRTGVDLAWPDNDDSSAFTDREDERVPDSFDRCISMLI